MDRSEHLWGIFRSDRKRSREDHYSDRSVGSFLNFVDRIDGDRGARAQIDLDDTTLDELATNLPGASFPRSASVSDEPEWPVEHRCECCGEAVWRVMTSDGDELEIDVDPLDIIVVGDQCVRENPVCRLVEAEGGYVLHDPQLFRGWQRDASQEEPAAWQWFISRMSLSRSVDENVVLRSAHAASCRAMTPRERAGSLARNRGERGSRRELHDMQEIGLRLLAASGADKYVPPTQASEERATTCQQQEVPLQKQLSLF